MLWDTRMKEAPGCVKVLGAEVESISISAYDLLVSAGFSINTYDLRMLARPAQAEQLFRGFRIKCLRSIPNSKGIIDFSKESCHLWKCLKHCLCWEHPNLSGSLLSFCSPISWLIVKVEISVSYLLYGNNYFFFFLLDCTCIFMICFTTESCPGLLFLMLMLSKTVFIWSLLEPFKVSFFLSFRVCSWIYWWTGDIRDSSSIRFKWVWVSIQIFYSELQV